MKTRHAVTNNGVTPQNVQPGFALRLQHSKALIAIVAVLTTTVMALTAALVVNRSEAQPVGVKAMPEAALPGVASMPATKLVSETPKHTKSNTSSSSSTPVTAPERIAQSTVTKTCANCGTVQTVTAVQKQGRVNGVAVGSTTIGLGTVAGGVLGGLLGHQVGGGNGKTAMTVLGAAGGAYAGNTVEKNMKKYTVYAVRVRMDDGSLRNMEVPSAISVGSKVIVSGKNLRMAEAVGSV